MIDLLRPWIGAALGILLVLNGIRMIRQRPGYRAESLIPASAPHITKIIGAVVLVVGALNFAINAPILFS